MCFVQSSTYDETGREGDVHENEEMSLLLYYRTVPFLNNVSYAFVHINDHNASSKIVCGISGGEEVSVAYGWQIFGTG